MRRSAGFVPDWSETPPRPGSYRSIFKWGDPRVFKHPNRRLYAMLKDRLGLSDADFATKRREGHERVAHGAPIDLDARHQEAIAAIVGPSNVRTDDWSRLRYSYGKTMLDLMRLREGVVENLPDLVVHPRSKADVAALVGYCHEHRIPITPYGGGSSVTRGTECPSGGLSLVLTSHLHRIVGLSELDHTVTVEPGIFGPALEQALNDAPRRLSAHRAYTCGHFPQSFEYSTVGGWIAALGSGQSSSYYGDAADLFVAGEWVTPVGSFATLPFPATATGPKVHDVMTGSEGAFGVLVSATMKVFRHLPANRQRFSFMFKTWQDGVDAVREVTQAQFGSPSVFRLSDPEETDVALKLYGADALDPVLAARGYRRMERCLLLGSADGERHFASNIKRQIKSICRDHGAMYTTSAVAKAWEHGRYRDAYLREDLGDYGVMIDTLECSVTWSDLHRVHQAVRRYIKARPHTVCMTHCSHFYPQGTNLYFIFIARLDDRDEYLDFHAGIIDRIQRSGASLSHHHGVGKLIAPWMRAHIGPEQHDVLRTLKRHFDPHGILNPGGTLGLDLPDEVHE